MRWHRVTCASIRCWVCAPGSAWRPSSSIVSSASTSPAIVCASTSWISRASLARSVSAAARAWAACDARSWASRSSALACAARAWSLAVMAERVKAATANTNAAPMSWLASAENDGGPASTYAAFMAAKMTRPAASAGRGGSRMPSPASARYMTAPPGVAGSRPASSTPASPMARNAARSGPVARDCRAKMTAVPPAATSRAATAVPMTAGDLPGSAGATPMATTARMAALAGPVIRDSAAGADPGGALCSLNGWVPPSLPAMMALTIGARQLPAIVARVEIAAGPRPPGRASSVDQGANVP